MAGSVIGIDFGTTTTLVAERPPGGLSRTVPIGTTRPWIPSLVAEEPGGALVVGEEAQAERPDRIVRSVKSGITTGSDSIRVPATGRPVSVRDAVSRIVAETVARARNEAPD